MAHLKTTESSGSCGKRWQTIFITFCCTVYHERPKNPSSHLKNIGWNFNIQCACFLFLCQTCTRRQYLSIYLSICGVFVFIFWETWKPEKQGMIKTFPVEPCHPFAMLQKSETMLSHPSGDCR